MSTQPCTINHPRNTSYYMLVVICLERAFMLFENLLFSGGVQRAARGLQHVCLLCSCIKRTFEGAITHGRSFAR